jgi:heterodisulfide reductase subunit A-like polyferredoxin
VSNKKKDRYIIPFDDIPTDRIKMPCIELDEAVCSFTEVETGLPEELARQEATRCLSCRRCLGCALCWAECDSQCIVFEQTSEPLEVSADSVIAAPSAVRKPARIASKFGFQESMNVVTDLQFERILAESGPYGGQILRPHDGDIPASIAFILAIEPDDKSAGRAYHMLLYGLKEAATALSKQQDLKVTFIVPAGYDFVEKFKETASKQAPGAEVVEGEIASVSEVPDTANIKVDCGSTEQEIELAVLLAGFALPDYMKELDRRLGLKLDTSGYWESASPEPAETAVSGVSLAGFRFSD